MCSINYHQHSLRLKNGQRERKRQPLRERKKMKQIVFVKRRSLFNECRKLIETKNFNWSNVVDILYIYVCDEVTWWWTGTHTHTYTNNTQRSSIRCINNNKKKTSLPVSLYLCEARFLFIVFFVMHSFGCQFCGCVILLFYNDDDGNEFFFLFIS